MKLNLSDVLGRLRLWQKLALLGWIAAFLVAIPFYLFLSNEEAVIDTAVQEQRGVEPLIGVFGLLQATALHRDFADRVTSRHDEASEADRRRQQQRVEAAIGKFDGLAQGLDYPGLTDQWHQIKQDWTAIVEAMKNPATTQPQSWSAHNELNRRLLGLISVITNGSKLILDPDPDTYNLQAILGNAAILSEKLAQARRYGAALLSSAKSAGGSGSRELGFEERIALHTMTDGAQQSLDAIREQMEQFKLAAGEGMTNRLDDPMRRLESLIRKALPLAQKEIVEANTLSYSPTDYSSAYAEAITATGALAEAGSSTINELFESKIGDARTVELSTAALILLVFSVAAIVAFLISRSITGPVNHLVDTMDQLALGDTSVRARIQSYDEIGILARHFDSMVDQREAINASILREKDQLNDSVIGLMQAVAKLAEKDLTVKVPVAEDITGLLADALNLLSAETANVMKGVVAIAQQVATVSAQVKSQADTVIGVATEEKREVEQTSQELNQLSHVMQDIAQLALDCNAVAAQAIDTTNRAQDTVFSTVEDITTIRDTIRETEKRIKRLGDRSQEIGTVVSIINGIADRTHILAINASMHAASAGEAGRGFAVVANEVQKLAENAREATSKISGLVSNIQLETADTIATMNDAITQVVRGTTQAHKAGEDMRATRDATANLVQMVERIASNSASQAQASQQLRERAAQIQHSTERTYEQLQEQEAQTERLVGYSADLVRTVSVFNVG